MWFVVGFAGEIYVVVDARECDDGDERPRKDSKEDKDKNNQMEFSCVSVVDGDETITEVVDDGVIGLHGCFFVKPPPLHSQGQRGQ